MTEKMLREKVVSIMAGWEGYSEANGKHKQIIDIYNAHKPLARGYKVKYTDEWCATCVSAAFIVAGLTDIAPTECGCGEMIELYRKMGRWEERDDYAPAAGDVIIYSWKDSGKGDCTTGASHVGIVKGVYGSVITVYEGNKNEAVGVRYIKVNDIYIRGYCLPDYKSKEADDMTKAEVLAIIKEYEAEKEKKAVSAWARKSWDKAKKTGVMDGTSPQGNATREMLAAVLDRVGALDKE